jgi:hypothetical protein
VIGLFIGRIVVESAVKGVGIGIKGKWFRWRGFRRVRCKIAVMLINHKTLASIQSKNKLKSRSKCKFITIPTLSNKSSIQ